MFGKLKVFSLASCLKVEPSKVTLSIARLCQGKTRQFSQIKIELRCERCELRYLTHFFCVREATGA
jgi:hypothetical protein